MLSFWRRAPVDQSAVDSAAFRNAMNRPAVARELFLPVDRAWWDGSRYTLGRWSAVMRRPTLHGVRLQEPRPAAHGTMPERDTQCDLAALVGSIAELRRVPEMSSLVLSEETLVGRQQGQLPGKRAQFGLRCPPDGRFQPEAPAAAECHRVLQRALRRAGFAIDYPKEPYNAASGFPGLRDWVGNVRLRRRNPNGRVLALIFLALMVGLPLLLFIPVPGTTSVRSLLGSNSVSSTTPGTTTNQPGANVDLNSLQKALGTQGNPTDLKSLAAKANPADPKSLVARANQPDLKAPMKTPLPNTPEADLDYAEKMLQEMQKAVGGTSGNGSPLLGGSALDDPSARMGHWMTYAGTAAYIIGGAWLLWVAPDAGIGALMGLLLLPGYALVVARSAWSKTWMPLLIHMGGMALVIWGVWLIFLPLYRSMQGLLG
jgi:hypothetical protein